MTSLRLTDFGIFYGNQGLTLLQPGLYVVHGHNGRGKTTLLNAIRWCLYGRYSDRQGRVVPPEVTLNRQARREGRAEFVVEVILLDGSDEYLLRRKQFISPSGPAPSQLYAERNGSPLTSGERERAIDQILGEQVSQFFLFDGEQLQRYELLLHEDGGSTLIKQGIEQILGLPIIDNSLADLGSVLDELNKRLAREARATEQLERLGVRAEQAQADLEVKDSEIALLGRERTEQRSVIAAKDGFLQKYENQIEQVKKLETLDERIAYLKQNRSQLRGLLAEELQETWRDVLAAAVDPKRKELERTVEKAQRGVSIGVLRELLEQSVSQHRCALCKQALEADDELQMEAEWSRHAAGTSETPGTGDFVLLQLLAPIVDTGHARIAIGLDSTIADSHSQELALRQESSRLREALENLPEGEVSDAQRYRDRAQQEIGRLNTAIEQATQERAEIDERLQRTRDEIRKANANTGQRMELARAIDLAQNLRSIFGVAKGQYRDQLRDAVEASASEVFRSLTNEPEFKKLRINGSYGLEILDAHGDEVGGRSAGQEQVVALSLIAALNRNARRRAPVVMDTPFGRLDPIHRGNILRFLGHLAEQVFLLVHGGEVRDEDLAKIAGDIRERFELARVDPDRTTIEVAAGG